MGAHRVDNCWKRIYSSNSNQSWSEGINCIEVLTHFLEPWSPSLLVKWLHCPYCNPWSRLTEWSSTYDVLMLILMLMLKLLMLILITCQSAPRPLEVIMHWIKFCANVSFCEHPSPNAECAWAVRTVGSCSGSTPSTRVPVPQPTVHWIESFLGPFQRLIE